MKKIVLFYKRLIKPGGAERLLLKEYSYFKKMGHPTQIVCFEFDNSSLFFNELDANDLEIVGSPFEFISILRLAKFINSSKDSLFICNSGHINYYLANLFVRNNYFLHLHQPSFMSLNEYDKYSFFKRKAFDELINSNNGTKRFLSLRNSFTFSRVFIINLRSLISTAAIKKAKSVFVLSDFAVKEKKLMYGIQALNITGALEDDIFQYKPNNIEEFGAYKNKLLTVARLDDKDKRIDILLVAYSKFLKKNPNSILVIGGSGSEYKNLINLSMELNIDANVKFVGFIPDEKLYDYYSSADLFVSIDCADFRITSYESMAMKTKVLLSSETDVDESLIKTGYYHLTEPTPEETAINIEKALSCPTLSKNSDFINILKKYTWSSYFSKIEKIISD